MWRNPGQWNAGTSPSYFISWRRDEDATTSSQSESAGLIYPHFAAGRPLPVIPYRKLRRCDRLILACSASFKTNAASCQPYAYMVKNVKRNFPGGLVSFSNITSISHLVNLVETPRDQPWLPGRRRMDASSWRWDLVWHSVLHLSRVPLWLCLEVWIFSPGIARNTDPGVIVCW